MECRFQCFSFIQSNFQGILSEPGEDLPVHGHGFPVRVAGPSDVRAWTGRDQAGHGTDRQGDEGEHGPPLPTGAGRDGRQKRRLLLYVSGRTVTSSGVASRRVASSSFLFLAGVKHWGDVEHGVMTQVVLTRNARTVGERAPGSQAATAINIAMKINMKLGGINNGLNADAV